MQHLIRLDRDGCGNLLIFVGDNRTLVVRNFWRECPWCRGASYASFEPHCDICHGEGVMTPWRALYWRLRLRWADAVTPLYVWWYEHYSKGGK